MVYVCIYIYVYMRIQIDRYFTLQASMKRLRQCVLSIMELPRHLVPQLDLRVTDMCATPGFSNRMLSCLQEVHPRLGRPIPDVQGVGSGEGVQSVDAYIAVESLFAPSV